MKDIEILQQAANEARGLAIDAINARKSGHLGLPLGCAEIGAVLFSDILNINPKESNWIGRDRFVLSAGHGSMFIYSWLYLSGYKLTIDDLKNFRVKGSKTPGHPEFGETDGVETTTGPLGQGISNAVGMAMSAKMASARFDAKLFNHTVFCLAGDGCFQEGISAEACSLAGHLKLDNLVIIFDSNDITLDAPADKSISDNAKMRFESYGFSVYEVNAHDIAAVKKTLADAKAERNGKPKIVIAKSVIAKGIAEVQGTEKGHGEGGVKFSEASKVALGIPAGESFYVSADVKKYFESLQVKRQENCDAWKKEFDAWSKSNPEKASELKECMTKSKLQDAKTLLASIPAFPATDNSAGRVAGGNVLNIIAKNDPSVITGSADLFGSTKNYIKGVGDFSAENYAGRNLWFGIREHAMGGIVNGFAYDGLFTASGATFLTFAGYMLGSIRIAALAKLPVQYYFTHDSIGVGYDGPTHQPVETVAILRCIPNLLVIRPADCEEAAAAGAAGYCYKGPTAFILSRQDLPNMTSIPVEVRREGTLKGAYIAKKETAVLENILIASGSEVLLALEAAEKLGAGTRVVSMPCMEIFDAQSNDYKKSVLPECKNVIAIEAGSSLPWHKYANKFVCTDTFGFSADGPELYEHFEITVDGVLKAVKA